MSADFAFGVRTRPEIVKLDATVEIARLARALKAEGLCISNGFGGELVIHGMPAFVGRPTAGTDLEKKT